MTPMLVTCLSFLDGEIHLASSKYKELQWFLSLHGLAPEYFCSRFEKRQTAYNLRDSEHKLNVPLPRTDYYKDNFSYSGAVLWNSLPREVR